MIKTIYLYAVSFVTLVMVIGGGIAVFASMGDLVAPVTYIVPETEYKMNPQDGTKEITPLVSYEKYVEMEKDRQQQQALNGMIKAFGFILVPAPLFVFTQRRLKEIQ